MNYSILNQEAVQQLMTSFGFNSLDQVDQLETITDYYNYLEKTDQKDLMSNGSQNFRHAKYISAVLKNQARETLFVNEPVANTLRDFRLPFDERNNPLDMSVSSLQKLLPEELQNTASEALSQNAPTRYVKPSSIQSKQSPAAYLKYIYDLANAIDDNSDFNLIARRPDLEDLVLNEDNLHQEVTTLELANELLIAQAFKKKVLSFSSPCRMETSVDIDLTESFTIEFWVRAITLSVESFTKALGLVSQPNQSAYVSFTERGKHIYFNPGRYMKGDIALDNKWHHFACTFDNNDDIAKIFQDGKDLNAILEQTDERLRGKLAPIEIATTYNTDLGAENVVEICEIRVWNTARKQEQIQEFMNKVVQATDDDYQNLLAYFPGDYIDGKLLNLIDTENFAEPKSNHENFKQVIVALPADIIETELYENLNKTFHPLELPFHNSHSEVRYTLAAIQEEISLSQIARRIKQNDFVFKDTAFTLIPNLVDRLNLYQSHLEVLQETPDAETMYRDWYRVEEIPIEDILVQPQALQLDLPLTEIVDGKVIDRSRNNFECIVHGNAEIVDDSTFGKCIHFDGVDDYIEIPPEAIRGESNEITISFWAYGDTDLGHNSILYAEDSNLRVVTIHLPYDEKIYFDCGNDGTDFDRIDTEDTNDDSKGKWTYWVFTKNVATGNMTIYVNGNFCDTGENNTKLINPASQILLGSMLSEDNSLRNFYKGKVAQFQIYNQELLPEEITEGLPPLILGLQLDLRLDEIVDGKVIDRSRNNFECTVHGDAEIVEDERFGKCIQFDGEDDYIEIPPEAIQIESNEITISFWAYGDSSLPEKSVTILYAGDERNIAINLPHGDGFIYFDCGFKDSESDRIMQEDTDHYFKDKWTYWVFTKNITNANMKIYVNGTVWHSGEDNTGLMNPVNKVVLGSLMVAGSINFYKGKVAHFQIYNRELSQEEIGEKYSPLSQVERFRESTKLSIEEFNQFYRNYRVKDDADNTYPTNEVYATYISNGHNLTLNTVDEKLVMGYDDTTYLNDDFFYRFNRIIRLQKRTNIPYYQLDWLLNTIENTDGLIDNDRLNVVAHYLYWNQKYKYSVDEFVGILTEVNSYRRMGEQETSLLRQIFGNAAPALVEVLKNGNTTFANLDSTLKEYLIIGLRITFAEYNAIVKAITDDDENAVFDKAALARMYRLVKVFTLFESGIAKGIELVEKLGLTEVFAHPGQKVSDVLSALDKLVSLSEWMNAEGNNLTIDNILTILTPPDKAGILQPTIEVDEFLDSLLQDIEEQQVVESSFTNYESWEIEKIQGDDNNETKETIIISSQDWYQLLQQEKDEDEETIIRIIDNYGLVLNVERGDIEKRVTQIINDKIAEKEEESPPTEEEEEYQLTEAAEEQKQELIIEIGNFQRRQQESLAKIITEKLSELSQEIIPVILLWMGTNYYETLKQLLGWKYPDQEVPEKLNQETLQLLYNINRHGIVVSQLELDAYTVLIAAEKPEWLVTDMTRNLSLEQVYYLYKFKTLLNAKVSSKHWLVYLATVNEDNEDEPEILEAQNKLLAALLDWSVEDIPDLTKEIPYCFVKTVQQIEYLRRQIEVCQDLHIQGEQLHELNSANGDEPEWEKAVAAVKLGLNRQNDAVRKKIATDAINLELRDALVANFMNEVVGKSKALKQKINSWEDIYQYLLLDVNVSPQVPTTRLLECTGAVQLYINRTIQGVENVDLDNDRLEKLKKDWDISQQYRLWEANKKLGLYPSSYVEPTLRLHKTEIFQTFEESLGQGSLNEEMVQQAVMQYLQQLQQLSELRVEGFTSQDFTDYIEFCFTAKATWETNSYYYRLLKVDKTKLEAGNKYAFEWGGWMKAELVFTQQHIYGVAPCYGWNRLYMYWFELFETRSEDGQTILYYLQPKYCRQNTDGSFGQPRGSVVEKNGSIVSQGIEIVGGGENIVEKLQVKIYQPYFDQTTGQILMYFYAGIINSLEFYSSVTSKEETVVRKTDDSLEEDETPDGYYAISKVPPALVTIEPGRSTYPSIEWLSILPDNREWSNLWLTGIELKWLPPVQDNGQIHLAWEFDCRGAYFLLDRTPYEVDHPSLKSMRNAMHEQTRIKFTASNNYFNEKDFVLATDSVPYTPEVYPLSIRLNNGSIDFKQDEDKTDFEIIVNFFTEWCYDALNYDGKYDFSLPESKEETIFTFRLLYNDLQGSVFVRNHTENNPSIAEQRFLMFSYKGSFYTTNLYSTAIQEVVQLAHPYYDVHQLFDVAHQNYKEEGIQHYLDALKEIETYSNISDPKPDEYMDFWGPYGIYAWEIFHYIPLMVAYKYTQSQNFDLAKKWLKHVYDPTLKNNPWGNYPLADQPNGISSSDLGINDPDARSREKPYYYRVSTIRQYIQNLIEQGDYYYRQITTETLRQAKMYYVEAKNLFKESTESLANIQIGEDWSDPTLGEVTNNDFIDPYDEEIIVPLSDNRGTII